MNIDRRIANMFTNVDIFVAEMEWVRSLSDRFWIYRLFSKNMNTIKSIIYANVMLLNLNVLMSPPEVDRPFYQYFFKYASLSDANLESLRVTYLLGVCNLCCYLVIIFVVTVTTLPIVIQEIDKKTERSMKTMDSEYFSNKLAFKWWIVTLVSK
jgi:hypothetical protein